MEVEGSIDHEAVETREDCTSIMGGKELVKKRGQWSIEVAVVTLQLGTDKIFT
jgi:hypothetical protein